LKEARLSALLDPYMTSMIMGYNQFQNVRKLSGLVSLWLPYMDI